jgi:hypothetical protein
MGVECDGAASSFASRGSVKETSCRGGEGLGMMRVWCVEFDVEGLMCALEPLRVCDGLRFGVQGLGVTVRADPVVFTSSPVSQNGPPLSCLGLGVRFLFWKCEPQACRT